MSSTVGASAPTPLFAGQAAAPPGPCDLTGMYVMHHAFRRDLARFAAASAATPAADSATWTALRRWWERVAVFLHEHHEKEDSLLWPALRSRVDADGARVLDEMEMEHDRIDPLLDVLEWTLPVLAAGDAPAVRLEDARQRAVAAFGDLATLLDAHLAHEEREAVVLIQRHLDAAEWADLERRGLASKPSPRLLPFMLSWIADGLRPDDLAPLLGGPAGAPLRALHRLGRTSYARLAERAFARADSAR